MIAQAMLKSFATPRIIPFFPENSPIPGPFRLCCTQKFALAHPRLDVSVVKYRDSPARSTSTLLPAQE